MAAELRAAAPQADIMIDPEYHATPVVGLPSAQLGHLEEWPHFRPVQRTRLLTSPGEVHRIVDAALCVQQRCGATVLIAPSVFIPSSFDSMEGALALAFLQESVRWGEESRGTQVLGTLVVHRDALVNQARFLEFMNGLTGMPNRPAGMYLVIGSDSNSGSAGMPPDDLVQPDVLAGWMYMNLVLSLNGCGVTNGFGDILMPLLGTAGAAAGATGWYSNLRSFSMDRYLKTPGIRKAPLLRYLSMTLLRRIDVGQREAYADLLGGVSNGLAYDGAYEGKEPDRTEEMMQTWEALRALNGRAAGPADIDGRLAALGVMVSAAETAWAQLGKEGFTRGLEAILGYLQSLREAIQSFRTLAEL
jgi:hypothetical protein